MDGLDATGFSSGVIEAFKSAMVTQINNAGTHAALTTAAVKIQSIQTTSSYHNMLGTRRAGTSLVEFHVLATSEAELGSIKAGIPVSTTFQASFETQAGVTVAHISSCKSGDVLRIQMQTEETGELLSLNDLIIMVLMLVMVARPLFSVLIIYTYRNTDRDQKYITSDKCRKSVVIAEKDSKPVELELERQTTDFGNDDMTVSTMKRAIVAEKEANQDLKDKLEAANSKSFKTVLGKRWQVDSLVASGNSDS